MSRTAVWPLSLPLAILVLIAAACGSSDDEATGAGGPTIVVTTSILGDVVGEIVGDQAEVITLMPAGTDPHDFQPSAQQANQLRTADAVVANGGGLEEGLVDVVEAAEADGVPVYEALDAVEPLDADEDGEHGDDEAHSDEEDDHDHGDVDPHFFTDPVRMGEAVDGLVTFLTAEAPDLDPAALRGAADAYQRELDRLVEEGTEALADIPEGQRVLITDHEVFGYLADRFDLEVVGTVIPSGSTTDGADARNLAELADLIEAEGVPAVFTGSSTDATLAETLAEEVGNEVAVVELYAESLGEPGTPGDTYLGAMRANLERIADALGGS